MSCYCLDRPRHICIATSVVENMASMLAHLEARGYRKIAELGCNLIVERIGD